jgi:hypothetical protein
MVRWLEEGEKKARRRQEGEVRRREGKKVKVRS